MIFSKPFSMNIVHVTHIVEVSELLITHSTLGSEVSSASDFLFFVFFMGFRMKVTTVEAYCGVARPLWTVRHERLKLFVAFI